MNEEKYIEEQVGRRNPFTVPEGYFDNFADQMMASLPERQSRAQHVWLRPMRYAAAVVCVLAMGAMAWFALSSSPDVHQPLQVEAVQVSGDAAFDEATDYAMIDNYDIYACLSEE
jgi:hypothetical protein